MAGREILVLLTVLSPVAGLACSPAPAEVTGKWQPRESCAGGIALDAYRLVGLGPASDLGGGVVVQDWYDGNACYWQTGLIVAHCGAAALAIGPDNRALAGEPQETGIDRIEAALAGGGDVAQLAAMAVAEGYDAPTDVSGGMSVDGVALPLGCACETYYPETAGGTN